MFKEISRDILDVESQIEMVRRSRNFRFTILMMIVAGVALFTFSGYLDIKDDILVPILFLDLFLVVVLIIYWYLQVQPININSAFNVDSRKDMKLQYQLERINEIEKAISIFRLSDFSDKESDDAIFALSKYISDRTDVLDYDNEYRKFDADILTNITRLDLFETSLETIKSRVLEEKKIIDERYNNKTDEESNKDKSLDRMAKIIDMATGRLKGEIAQLSRRSDIYIVFGSGITLIAGAFLYITVQDLMSIYSLVDVGDKPKLSGYDVISVVIRFQ